MAQEGHAQRLGKPAGPLRVPVVGEHKEGDPLLSQGRRPVPHRLCGLRFPIGRQGIVQIGQQEADAPPGQGGGLDVENAPARPVGQDGKRHGFTSSILRLVRI